MSALDTWMPLYIGDYLGATPELTIEQSGAYLHLLMQYWQSGPLPDDDAKLAVICRVSRVYFARHLKPAIRPYFELVNGRLTQRRADDERARRADISEKRSLAVKKRGKKLAENIEKNPEISGKNIDLESTKTAEKTPIVLNENNELGLSNDPTKSGHLIDTAQHSTTQIEERKEGTTSLPVSEGVLAAAQTAQPETRSTGAVVAIDPVSEAVRLWNEMASSKGLPQVNLVHETRRKHLKLRLEEAGGLDGWKVCLDLIADSPFLLGQGDARGVGKPWKGATFDWVINLSNFTKIMEGNYARTKAPDPLQRRAEVNDEVLRVLGLGPDGRRIA